MTPSTGERLYRACIRCRKRKAKCDMQSIGHNGLPPCLKCFNDGAECSLAPSRRGGDYTHARRSSRWNNNDSAIRSRGSRQETEIEDERPLPAGISTPDDEGPITADLQNPHDALQILAQVAANKNNNSKSLSPEASRSDTLLRQQASQHTSSSSPGPLDDAAKIQHPARSATYQLIQDGVLNTRDLFELLTYYHKNYHPFLPIAAEDVIVPVTLGDVFETETFLLTAILTVSSMNRAEYSEIHTKICAYMQTLLLDIVLGKPSTQHVGCVEGLLILAEWVPHLGSEEPSSTSTHLKSVGGSEDTAAWSLLGLAVRQGYLLRLDKTSFRSETQGNAKPKVDRKRLAWTFAYLADRQISIRMGQAFWCRGPGLGTQFTAEDFPKLRSKRVGDEDYASIMQAMVEITVLFGNAHDILYASKARTIGLILMGDYTKYLDDSAKAMAAWKEAWQNLEVSFQSKCCLKLIFEYLRLYVNAFAFQAVLSRAPPRSAGQKRISCFPHSVFASADGRHVYEAINAAKSLLKVMAKEVDSQDLRHMPVRYYLYGIYSAVFLFKAHAFGASTPEENRDAANLVKGFINKLKDASTGEDHIASRHSRLLQALWAEPKGRQGRRSVARSTVDTSAALDTVLPHEPEAISPGGISQPYSFGIEQGQLDFTGDFSFGMGFPDALLNNNDFPPLQNWNSGQSPYSMYDPSFLSDNLPGLQSSTFGSQFM